MKHLLDIVLASLYNDAPEHYGLTFQDAASSLGEEIIWFHDKLLFYFLLIGTVVLWMITQIVLSFRLKKRAITHKYLTHGTTLEIIWTLTPALILVTIAFPSFKLLYLMDEVIDPSITVKAIGHQWYWSYEYSDYAGVGEESISFDSYMIPQEDLEMGQLRLLEVDNRVVLPVQTHIRVIITAADVLHSWAVPSLGIKCDAVPGRLNAVSFLIKRPGVYYGQCSEICGVQHAGMPIVVEAVSLDDYVNWVESQLANN